MVQKPKIGEKGFSPDEPLEVPEDFAGFTEAERIALIERTQPPELEGFGELTDALRRLYPASFDPALSFGFSEEEIPMMVIQQVETFAFQDPERFLNDLLLRSSGQDAAIVLSALGASEADIVELLAGVPVLKEAKDEALLYNKYLSIGGKLDVDAWRQSGSPLRPGVEQQVTPIETGWQAVWNNLRTSAARFWFQTKDAIFTILPQAMFPDMDAKQLKELKELGIVLTPEEIELHNVIQRDRRDIFREQSVENREQYEEWVRKHPELKPPPEWEGEILPLLKDDPTLILNPAFIAFIAADSAAFMAAFWGATAIVGFATRNPIAGMAAGVVVTTPAQSQDLYEDLLWAGAKEQQAAQLAVPVGLLISSVEMLGGLAVLRAVGAMPGMRPFYQLFRRNLQREVAKGILSTMTKRGLVSFTEIQIAEIFEEIIQSAIQNALVKTFDESREVLGGITETVLRTFISVLPLGILGGGVNVAQTYRQMTAEQRQQVEERQDTLEDAGLPSEQAEMVAFTEFAETPEGQEVVEESAKEAKPEVTLPIGELAVPEPGMPEPRIQPSMIEEIPFKEVRPPAKAEIVQISMEDQLKLKQAREAAKEAKPEEKEAFEAQAEVEGLKVSLEIDPVAQARFKLGGKNVGLDAFISIREQTFPETFTVKQAEALFPGGNFSRFAQKGTPQYNKVPRDAALDDLTKQFNMTPDEIANRAMAIRQEEQRIKQLESQITEQFTEKPLTSQTDLTVAEVTENFNILGRPKLTLKQVNALVGFFADYLNNPSLVSAWSLTRELRRETRAERAESLKARTQELIVVEGFTTENAMKQAISETLAGELPTATTEYLQDMTDELRDALFAKVLHVLKNEPLEMAATVTALTNALTGRPIPREPGVRGGSAFTRLQRVFGDQPKVLRAIDKMAKEKKPLEDVVDGIFRETGRDPIPVDQETADYVRGLSSDIIYEVTAFKDPIPVTKFEVPIDGAFKQIPLLKFVEKKFIVRILKEMGMLPIDIGNFLRANKASVDFSFWRQQKLLAVGHPISFYRANIEAWKALWRQKDAEANWEWISRDPIFQIYEDVAAQGKDFLRPLELKKGTSQWLGVEEFGYLTGERLLPRLTGKIPWVKISARSFVTGTNTHNWLIFKNYHKAMLRYSQKISTGEIKLPEGEAFDMGKEMLDFAGLLADFTQRATLGKAMPLAPALSAAFFAPRSKLGRLLAPRHLVSANPHIRAEAWKDFMLFISVIGGLVMSGYWLGLWDVERDPRSGEYMSIRIGNLRIDPWAGYRQFLVLYARLITGTGVSSVTGAEYEVNPIGALTSFIRSSAAPMATIILDFWTGKNFIGETVDVANKKQWVERISPFSVQDVWEAYEEGWEEGAIAIIPAILGEGVQTYTGEWEENFTKLGLPKYMENTAYDILEPKYDTQDFWADTSAQFKDVDPATLTEAKGFPEYIRAIAEARIINEHLKTLPNEKLVKLNADPAEGATFADYYQMWKDREKLVAAGDKARLTIRELQPDGKYKDVTYKGEEAVEAFDRDERTRNAQLGNMSQRQYALLIEYHSIIDEDKQKEFLEKHKDEIDINPRQDWLRTNPKENAQLAVWGQAKILSLEAYNEFKKLVMELDIPDNAIPEMTLPPEGSVENYFEYQKQGEEFGYNSWEVQMIMVKDPELREWLEREEIVTPVRSLEIKIRNRELTNQYEELETDEERDAFRLKNPEWVDDQRRIEAIDNEGSEQNITDWVDRGHLIDQFSGGSSEAIIWLLDHPETYDWAIEQELLTDRKEELLGQEPVLRINVDWRTQDEEYDAIQDPDTRRETELRQAYLEANEEYAKQRRIRDALQIRHPDDFFRKFPEVQFDNYVNWYNDKELQRPDTLDDRIPWFEDDWFLIANPLFHDALVEFGIFKEHKDLTKVPTRDIYKKFQVYILDKVEGKPREDYRWDNQDLDAWLVLTGKVTIPITEKRLRAELSPSERFRMEIQKKRKEFQDALDKLKELLK